MKILAIINKDEEIRRNSSSGGVFYLLAESVISRGGVVFGAKFDENFEVIHGYTETIEGVRDYMTSKYVQSFVGSAYKDAERFLKEGRPVLFTGTPCQVAALRSYLPKDYENLLTLDFICHGVPSRRVWREYIAELSDGREISAVRFRDKSSGWRVSSLRVDFSDGSSYLKDVKHDIFTKGFISGIYQRPSCHECKFRGLERVSDVTVADFWGADKEVPRLYDNKGTSLAIIRNQDILDIIYSRKEDLEMEEISTEVVRRTNPNIGNSPKPNRKRAEFFSKEYSSITKHINGYVKVTPIRKVRQILFIMMKKLKGSR